MLCVKVGPGRGGFRSLSCCDVFRHSSLLLVQGFRHIKSDIVRLLIRAAPKPRLSQHASAPTVEQHRCDASCTV
jgi:hypothetical protein